MTLELMSHSSHIAVSTSWQSLAGDAHGRELTLKEPHSLPGESTTAASIWKKPGWTLGTFGDYTLPADANICAPAALSLPALRLGLERGARPFV